MNVNCIILSLCEGSNETLWGVALRIITCYPQHDKRIRFVILSVCEGSHEILRAKALRM